MTHICVSKLTIIVSDNGLSPGWRQAIIWTNDGILLIRPLRTNFSEILIEFYTFSFKKIDLKMSSEKTPAILSRPQCVKFRGVIVISALKFADSRTRRLGQNNVIRFYFRHYKFDPNVLHCSSISERLWILNIYIFATNQLKHHLSHDLYVCMITIYPQGWLSFPWWRHQMEAYSALLALCAGNSP